MEGIEFKQEIQCILSFITYGPDAGQTREFVQQDSKILNKSPVWRDLGARVMVCTRRSANLRDLLYKRKAFSLSVHGENKGTSPRGVKRCLSCKLVNPVTTVTSTTTSNCYRINCNATCISRCLVYLAECTVCKK